MGEFGSGFKVRVNVKVRIPTCAAVTAGASLSASAVSLLLFATLPNFSASAAVLVS